MPLTAPKSKSGFTIIELLVSMLIIAMLLGLGVFGLRIMQQTGRDSQRQTKLAEIKQSIDYYYRIYARFPGVGTDFRWVGVNQLVVGTRVINLNGVLTRSLSNRSDIDETYYVYSVQTDGYRLCTVLENTRSYNLGISMTPCP